jgi:hypothetical protein
LIKQGSYCITQPSRNQKFDRIYRINKIFKFFHPVNLVNPVEKFSRMTQICSANSVLRRRYNDAIRNTFWLVIILELPYPA